MCICVYTYIHICMYTERMKNKIACLGRHVPGPLLARSRRQMPPHARHSPSGAARPPGIRLEALVCAHVSAGLRTRGRTK